MILVEHRSREDNKNPISASIDDDRAVAIWDNKDDAIWIATLNGQRIQEWCITRDTARALVWLLLDKLA